MSFVTKKVHVNGPDLQLRDVAGLPFRDPQSCLLARAGHIMPRPGEKREGLRAKIKTKPYHKLPFLALFRSTVSIIRWFGPARRSLYRRAVRP